MTNSRAKGKRFELAAAKFLRSIGFDSARRGQQFRGGCQSPDVICEELPHIHLEIKANEKFDIGTKLLQDAYDQADFDKGPRQTPVVLWKRNRAGWRLTYLGEHPCCLVTVPEGDIRHALLFLNQQ